MGRIALRRVEYVGDRYRFVSPNIPDGLVIVEGSNGSGKTTFADLIYFALGGAVSQFAKSGQSLHKEIRSDTNNFVRVRLELGGRQLVLQRRFEAPQDVLVTSIDTGQVEVLPVTRRDASQRILSDRLLEDLGIHPVMLFFRAYGGRVNFTDLVRLIYHDQDPDPTRVFKSLDSDNFVADSREFRRAIFELLIGRASEAYYEALAAMRAADEHLARQESSLVGFDHAVDRTLQGNSRSNADFLRASLGEREAQLGRLETTRATIRRASPLAPSGDAELVVLRRTLTATELKIAELDAEAHDLRSEQTRLSSLHDSFIEEVVRVQKIIHAHETLALFSPDTCPCCLRHVSRPTGSCVCGQAVDEAAYQRFFYDTDEYMRILKSRQKNVETVADAIRACDRQFDRLTRARERANATANEARAQMSRWAGVAGSYGTELDAIDNEIVEVRVAIERLRAQLDLEAESDRLRRVVTEARERKDDARARVQELEATARRERAETVTLFNQIYSRLMRQTLANVTDARLGDDYEPIINAREYREASARVARRLMYYVTLLEMSLVREIPFPRFLLIDTPETAGIDQGNLSRAISKIAEVLNRFPDVSAQVVLTTGPGKYPAELQSRRLFALDDSSRLLAPVD